MHIEREQTAGEPVDHQVELAEAQLHRATSGSVGDDRGPGRVAGDRGVEVVQVGPIAPPSGRELERTMSALTDTLMRLFRDGPPSPATT